MPAVGVSQEYLNSLRRQQPSPAVVPNVLHLDQALSEIGYLPLRARWAPAEPWAAPALPKYEPLPRLYGLRRFSPPNCAKPQLLTVGGTTYTTVVKCLGPGPLTLSDFRIGTQKLNGGKAEAAGRGGSSASVLGGVSWEVAEGASTDPGLSLYPEVKLDDKFTTKLALKTSAAGPGSTRTAGKNADDFAIELSFPSGLSRPSGTAWQGIFANFAFSYRAVGATTWVTAGNKTVNGANNNTAFTSSFTFKVPSTVGPGDYEWQVVFYQISAGAPTPTVNWTRLISTGPSIPTRLDNICLVVLRAKVQAGVDAEISGFSCQGLSRLRTWNGSVWASAGSEVATNNPAAVYLDILRGSANDAALADSRIDLATLGAWYTECSSAGRQFNLVLTGRGTVQQALQAVAACGRAAPGFRDALYSVVREPDPASAVDRAPITPRNTTRLRTTKVVVQIPHGLRSSFFDAEDDFQQAELIVYSDGYSLDGAGATAVATAFQRKTYDGVTDPSQVFKLGRYGIAALIQRPEVIEADVDWEHLRLSRGDVVRVSDPTLGWGTGWGRVKVVSGSVLELDEDVTMALGGAYQIRFWLADGTSLLRTVTTDPGTGRLVTVTSTPTGVAAGDLFTFGTTADGDSVRCLVKRIEALPEFGARLTLVELGTGIYDAGSGTIPAFDSKVSQVVGLSSPGVSSASASNGNIDFTAYTPNPPPGKAYL